MRKPAQPESETEAGPGFDADDDGFDAGFQTGFQAGFQAGFETGFETGFDADAESGFTADADAESEFTADADAESGFTAGYGFTADAEVEARFWFEFEADAKFEAGFEFNARFGSGSGTGVMPRIPRPISNCPVSTRDRSVRAEAIGIGDHRLTAIVCQSRSNSRRAASSNSDQVSSICDKPVISASTACQRSPRSAPAR